MLIGNLRVSLEILFEVSLKTVRFSRTCKRRIIWENLVERRLFREPMADLKHNQVRYCSFDHPG